MWVTYRSKGHRGSQDMRGGLVARFFLFFTFFTFRFDISFFSFSISFFSSMFLVARRVIIFALLESARARRGAAWRRETRRLKDWNFVRFKQPYLLQISTTQSMLLDPCDMENQYLSRWRAAGGTPLFPRVQHKHHTPVSSVKRAHSSRQLWGPDAVTGAGMRRRSRRRRSRAQQTSEIEEWRRVSWGQLSAPRSRQRAQDFKRARRGSS